MKTKIQNNLWLVATFLIVCLFQIVEAADSPTTGIEAPVLSLAIRCTNEVVKAGDEIDIEFRITNRGTNDYKYADRTYDRSGRMDEYKLVVTNNAGEAIPDPRTSNKWGWFGGGLFQFAILKPGQSFIKIIPLNRWTLVKESGRYEVVGSYMPERYSTNSPEIISVPIIVEVLPRTPQEMNAYIGDLSNQLAAAVSDALVMKLMFTCNPKIVPALLDAMYKSGSSRFWETEALNFYIPHSEATKQEIVTVVNKRGLTDGMPSILSEYGYTNVEAFRPFIERSLALDNPKSWQAGATAAQQYGNDTFTPRLIALATEPGNSARMQAIYALAANRTDESVKTLKSLLNDADPQIRKTTERAIRTAYNWRGIWQGRLLKPEDFDEQYQVRDPMLLSK